MNEVTCEDCFRIKCKQCNWVASDAQVLLIQQEIMKTCPECGWSPSSG